MDFSEALQLNFSLLFLLFLLALVISLVMYHYFPRQTVNFFNPPTPTPTPTPTPIPVTLQAATINLQVAVTVALLAISFGAALLASEYESGEVKDGKARWEVNMSMDGAKIQTDSILVYVGRTKNYLFLYNRKLDQTQIFKSDKINQIQLTKHDGGYFYMVR